MALNNCEIRLGLWTYRHSSASSTLFYAPKKIARKSPTCGDPKISMDRSSWGRLRLHCSTVDPNPIAGRYLTAALRSIAFPLPIAYRCHGADLLQPVCRNSIACHPWPLVLSVTPLLPAFRKQVVKISISSFRGSHILAYEHPAGGNSRQDQHGAAIAATRAWFTWFLRGQ